MHKLNYERSPTTEAKQIVRSIKYFVSTNHIAVTRKSKLKKKKQSGRSKLFCCTIIRRHTECIKAEQTIWNTTK